MKHIESRLALLTLVTAAAIGAWFGGDAAASPGPWLSGQFGAVPVQWLSAGAAAIAGGALLIGLWRRPRTPAIPLQAPAATTEPACTPREAGADPEPPPAAAADTGAAAPAPAVDPAPAPAAAADQVLLELNPQGRIMRCAGAPLQALVDDLDLLDGNSLLQILPAAARAAVVDGVRSARDQPGTPIALPKLRLCHPQTTGRQSEPMRLVLQADADGAVSLHGRVADEAAAESMNFGGSDERFSRVFHSSPDVILIISYRDGTLIDFNASFTRLIGYTREQAIGQVATELDLWVDPEQRLRVLGEFSRERQVTDREVLLRGSDQREVAAELSMRFIELDGQLCVLCIARDISKRRAAEQSARSNAEKFTQVFSRSPDGVLILQQGTLLIRDANPAAVAGSAYAIEELIGQPISLFQPDADADAMIEALDALERDGHLSNREMRIQGKGGHELTVLVSATPTEIDNEPSILCIIKDVSDLRHTQEQLRRSEERFRGAFENAPIGILLLDPRGHIFQANRFATELLSYPDGALDHLHVSRLVPADERADLKEQLERLLRGNDSAQRAERRLLCADGLEIWTNCHMVLQRGRAGEPLYCIMQIADITEMKTSQQRMEQLAFYDTLTELANRRLFNDRLQQALEHCRRNDLRAALLYLDLDQFKRVNDTLGHESGDALLKEVASRLLKCVRKEDTVGRPGGDEFTVLLYDIDSPTHAGTVAEKILRELERPITISGHQLIVTTSIGITILPDDGEQPNALTKNADLAMYRAKEKGRNNYQFFSEDLNTTAVHRLRTEYELRRALERSEFELHYQPTVRLADQSIVGAECLLRWNHPERGMVMPGEFIGIAEETGAIVEIGSWVIEEACAAARLMADQRGAPLCIAVNISPRQFRDPTLVDTIRQSLRRAQLDPACLELEITETMLMQDIESTSEIVQRLHRLGVRLAIDDFGTGYSSLNYLKKFPINTVKVDRTFVADIPQSSDDMEITAAVIAMAHRLRMEVVAEGVETIAQLEFLAEQQCDFAQGFLFSRAVPLREIGHLLAQNVSLLPAAGRG